VKEMLEPQPAPGTARLPADVNLIKADALRRFTLLMAGDEDFFFTQVTNAMAKMLNGQGY
jgi:hypothetical protein